MKRHLVAILLFALLVLGARFISSAVADLPSESGSSVMAIPGVDNISELNHRRIKGIVAQNVLFLKKKGVLYEVSASSTEEFVWPLKTTSFDPGAWAISNFVDHHPSTSSIIDFEGGERTYDGHRGTDIFLFPFPWNRMESGDGQVVAATAGVIVGKDDGSDDKSCSRSAPNTPNSIIIKHPSGAESWYLHMKNGSVTTKAGGAAVSENEVLGVVGSSGMSSGPHLHFEVYDSLDNLIDPFVGPHNSTTTFSWWKNHRAYRDPGINKMTVGNAAPELPECTKADSHETNLIRLGESPYATTYFREREVSELAENFLLKPNGTIFARWIGDTTQFYPGSYWFRNWTLS